MVLNGTFDFGQNNLEPVLETDGMPHKALLIYQQCPRSLFQIEAIDGTLTVSIKMLLVSFKFFTNLKPFWYFYIHISNLALLLVKDAVHS